MMLLVGCEIIPGEAQKLNPVVYYRHDIKFEYKTGRKINVIDETVDDMFGGHGTITRKKDEYITYWGTAVLPYKSYYELKVTGYDKLNFFALSSCHEETTDENPDRGIFKKKGVVKFSYIPKLGKDFSCPLYVAAYNRKGKHSSGFVAFEDPKYTLPATLHCNGEKIDYNGTSVCQSREGLIQKIVFAEPVKLVDPVKGLADRKDACPEIGEDGKTEYVFKLPGRECIYGFLGKNTGKIHRLFAIGYEDIVIRE